MHAQRIGRYDVTAELGRGATSIVYKAVDPADGRVLALKTLKRDGSESESDAEQILQLFRQELRIFKRLRHPGMVTVDEFGEDGLHSWLAMEYVEGCNLDEFLVRTPQPGQTRALAMMDELLDTLDYLHREGVFHRDVKPGNLLVTPEGRVRLTDFGVARLRGLGLTQVSTVVGTPAFMAPEQFRGGMVDGRADLFACGVLLFMLLGGRRPFLGSPAAVMHQILNEEPPSLADAGAGASGSAFDAVVARALAKRPEDRFATADEMRTALRVAARHAAESPLATVVNTVVRDAVLQIGSAQTLASLFEERAPARPAEPRVVVSGARDQARLVDAASLYTPEGDQAG